MRLITSLNLKFYTYDKDEKKRRIKDSRENASNMNMAFLAKSGINNDREGLYL